MKKYNPREIEKKWQKIWQETKIYQAQDESKKPKKYILDMFPYPSGDGLHVGHFKTYTASDILARFHRAKGFNVLHPMGWDAFGLPAENYAIKTGIHPKITTEQNINTIKNQMMSVGFSYDWDREIDTTDPKYYKWTQWIFIKLFEKGLAYEDEAPINWCPSCKTGLANEEVVKGHCDRCGTKVERKVIRQWVLKITKYADRLLSDLEALDWPEFIKQMQINWIGRSEGAKINFSIEAQNGSIETFTTRIDTIFGVTALVLAPEHPMVNNLITSEHKQLVNQYIKISQNKSDLERTELIKEKTGVFTGSYAINPLNNKKIPIWVADYVLGFYGTGAVMLVPAHDQRDYKFAQKYNLDIVEVISSNIVESKNNEQAYTQDGVLINSGEFSGLGSKAARSKITEYIESKNIGSRQVQYHLRDWIFSRQRYWGEPIPIIHCPKCKLVPVPEDQLPLTLPEIEKFEPTGTVESPLASISNWVNTTCPKCAVPAKRETNTMPQWAGSCWYYLRFTDPHNDKKLVSEKAQTYWLPVDWYIGGAEHAVLHLLYARFWHKFLYDIGVVSTKEPFQKLSSVGLVLAEDGRKMSKSLGNVVRPDDIVKNYSADTLRAYEAFMGPFENAISWDPTAINGVYKFLNRFWNLLTKDESKNLDSQIQTRLNKLIQKVEKDLLEMKFNTAIASMMEFLNFAYQKNLNLTQKKTFLKLLAPFAPHITEELWQILGESGSIHTSSWPEIDQNYPEDELVLVIQINGRVRDTLKVAKEVTEEEVKVQALKSPRIQKFIADKTIKKSIYIPKRILNLVI